MQTPFKSKKYFYTIIDCPGHREFIQKMLTGASQADAAILVVSAKEGIEPQTKQHLFLIKTLGIKQLIIAVNKMDTIGYSKEALEKFSKDLVKVLSSLGYADAPIVPVSAFYGDNVATKSDKMKWYKNGTLIEVLDKNVKPPQSLSKKPLRCVVQDIYELGGEKVAVCMVETGTLKNAQSILVMPIMEEGVVEKIESFGKEATEVLPGESVGVVMKGITDLKRGQVLVDAEQREKQTEEFVAELIIFSDLTLRVGDTTIIRIGTAEIKCRIKRILDKIDPVNLIVEEDNPASLENGEVGKVLFQALEPLYLEEYSVLPQLGRFVIVGKKGAAAAGIVLEK
jgi:elongation factor 1-alpha